MSEIIVVENDAKASEFLSNFHLLNLPDNVLKMILRMLFLRPAPLIPSNFQSKNTANEKPTVHYGYQWANTRRHLYEEGKLPQVDHVQILTLAWTSNPTDAESKKIARGPTKLSDIVRLGGKKEKRSIHVRKDFGPQIIHKKAAILTGIEGIPLLRSCKRISTLGSAVLYGENTFVFDTRGGRESPGLHPANHLRRNSLDIPGLSGEGGMPQTTGQTRNAIENMFDRYHSHAEFIITNPLTRFFLEIGRSNASNITNVVLHGHFHSRRNKYREMLSFEQILPIQTVILSDVCKKLNKVTLHDDDRGRDHHPYFNERRSIEKKRAIDFSEIIDGAVQKLVEGLPMMQELQLGDYRYVPKNCGYDVGVRGSSFNAAIQPDDGWKSSLQWMNRVEKRARRQAPLAARAGTKSKHSRRKRVTFPL
ncbi:9893aa67-6449-43eb-a47d-3da6a4df96a7 [Sclerotinia trifoliorum]|uniref:9893aa67-6449-43eb-a47d-3da6a4df96a7 n=1 Tax=Sclerotinia trifoliorum TaxID=28548 RepID=A0A8H2ZT78_9HELO|nr:9893aa67-6449-43eb-a47d-3da6a4df96a7 [Sclerotinia trifoliorum]